MSPRDRVAPGSQPPSVPGSRVPVWLPWLAAPVFMLLPIVGCGAAASLRQPEVAAASPPPAPVRSVVAIMQVSR
jgi:hypothetical protein